MRTIPHLRWYIVALLFFETVISYVDRQTLSVNAPLIRGEYGLSNAQYSYLITAFLVAYTIGQPLVGRLVDWLGTRAALALCMMWWSIASMLHAWAGGFASLAVCRFLLGVGESGSVPGAMRGISEWFPERERSLATGIFAGGTTMGVLVSPPLVAFVTLAAGWRAAFLVTGFLGFLWLIPWLWLYRLPELHPRIEPEERAKIVAGRLDTSGDAHIGTFGLLRYRKPWGIILGRFMMDPVWWFYVFWLPVYLSDVRAFSLQAIGLFAWIPFLAAGVGTFVGGWLSGRLLSRGAGLTRARKTVLFLSAAGTLFGVPASLARSPWVCLFFISIVTFCIGAWATNIMTLNADILPPRAVGSMTGLSGGGAALGGVIFTMLTGWLVDRFSYGPVFWLAGTAPLVGFVLLSTLIGEIRPLDLAVGRLSVASQLPARNAP